MFFTRLSGDHVYKNTVRSMILRLDRHPTAFSANVRIIGEERYVLVRGMYVEGCRRSHGMISSVVDLSLSPKFREDFYSEGYCKEPKPACTI